MSDDRDDDRDDDSGGGDVPASRPIDVGDPAQLRAWARRLDTTPEQIKEAVEAVGDHPDDVEMHLKGSRSSTNSERVSDAG
jgi:hypothetical protein